MKFNKVSFAILIASGALMGCEIGGGDNSPATTMPEQHEVEKKNPFDVAGPVENISEVVGSLHTGSAYNYNPENYGYDSGNHALKNTYPSPYYNTVKDIGRNLTFTVGSDGNVHASMRVAGVKYEKVPNPENTDLYGTVCVGGDCYYNVERGEWVGNGFTYYGYHNTAKELTSTSVDKLENGAIKVVFNDENTNEAYKLLLGANMLPNFNEQEETSNFGIWQKGSLNENGEFVSNNSIPQLFHYARDIMLNGQDYYSREGEHGLDGDVTFTGKTLAIRRENGQNTEMDGNASLNISTNASDAEYHLQLDFNNWKNIELQGNWNISNGSVNKTNRANAIYVDNEAVKGEAKMNVNLIKTGEHRESDYNMDPYVNEYGKATGIYDINYDQTSVVGGFAVENKDGTQLIESEYHY